ncbi:hypothetical protein K435DRAFT_876688 [Dendrothele bispora CBS 962.96]|uniref:Uncharacterized protein n=1 Tax=Dendrothele bispora (strain CBS 962.96) TaxID=1314807 RepID=A0A4S8KRI4_DENBC|nr:hypothetical protein K435DRAFT_876688 [Dendrothele bispora CBS 962.96]
MNRWFGPAVQAAIEATIGPALEAAIGPVSARLTAIESCLTVVQSNGCEWMLIFQMALILLPTMIFQVPALTDVQRIIALEIISANILRITYFPPSNRTHVPALDVQEQRIAARIIKSPLFDAP